MDRDNEMLEKIGYGDTYVFEDNKYKLKVQIINKSKNQSPEFKTVGSSGMDIRANFDDGFLEENENDIFITPDGEENRDKIIFKGGNRMIVPTGVYMKVPEGFEIQVRPRSGLAAKKGITVLNSPGTIDSDYRGEIKVILYNTGDTTTINQGERIAQLIIAPVLNKSLIKTENVNEFTEKTERNAGGFGSTGSI